jgi:hypothetical protein
LIAILALGPVACSDSSTTPDSKVPAPDSAAADTGAPDTGAAEAGTPDVGPGDAAGMEASAPDSAAPDAARPDAAAPDAARPDAATPDASPADAAASDLGPAAPPDKVSPANLVLWLSAGSGVTLSGTKVTKWKDQSKNGLDATASSGYEPTYVSSVTALNGRPALQMNKSFLSCGASKTFDIATPTMFVVSTAVTGGITVTKSFGSGGTSWRKLELNAKSFRAGADSNAIAHNATIANSNIYVLASASKNSHVISVNGAAKTSTSTLYHTPYNTADFKIGGSKAGLSSVSGQLAEIVLYNKALSTTERKQVECYLAAKYKITTSGCP